MAVNDEIMNNLAQYEGGNVNERIYNFLGNLGYTGTLSDRLANYSSEGRKGWQGLLEDLGIWTPAQLFSQGEQGLFFVPKPVLFGSQFLYQDSAGTTLIDANGDPVGLGLEWSRGLERGPEIYPSGTVEANTPSFWTDNFDATVSGNIVSRSGDGTGGFGIRSNVAAGYGPVEISLSISNADGQAYIVEGSGSELFKEINLYNGAGEVKVIYNFDDLLYIRSTGSEFTVDNISVRELPGNHLTQPTSADRPTYNTDGSLHWLGFDNVSDFMDMSSVETAVTTTVSVFMTHRRADTEKLILLSGNTTGDYTFIAEAGNEAGQIVSSQGSTPAGSVVRIDGVEKTTRDAIHLATNDLDWHVWEVEGLTLAQWGAFYMGRYGSNGAGYRINGDCAGIVVVEESSTIDRDRVRSYMAKLGGFAL